MRMELAYQWDLVEDEVPTLFESLLDTIKSELGYLKDQVNSEYAVDACTLADRPTVLITNSSKGLG